MRRHLLLPAAAFPCASVLFTIVSFVGNAFSLAKTQPKAIAYLCHRDDDLPFSFLRLAKGCLPAGLLSNLSDGVK